MSGFDNEVVYCNNWDFRGVQPVDPQVTASGQLPIGTGGSPAILVGKITSPLGTVTIGYSSPNITLEVAGGAAAVEHLTGDTGGQLNPTANNFNIISSTLGPGTTPIQVAGSGSTLSINLQRSQAIAAADSTKVGLANFDSAAFDVSATGFVQLKGGLVS